MPNENDAASNVGVIERFKRYSPSGDEGECWIWQGSIANGYGQLSGPKSVPYKAHRLAYVFAYGSISDGAIVRHRCDTPACVNPRHLELGTQADNMQDASKRGRLNAASLSNLRPGAPGFHGAGPQSNKEKQHGNRR